MKRCATHISDKGLVCKIKNFQNSTFKKMAQLENRQKAKTDILSIKDSK